MSIDDRFEELVGRLGGFYRTWYIDVGLELGLFSAIRAAGRRRPDGGRAGRPDGDPSRRSSATGRGAQMRTAWSTLVDGRVTLPEDVAAVLLDSDRPEYLGGQFVHAATAALDYGELLGFVRTGVPMTERPDRYRIAIERLTVQDIAVFFQEALAAVPQLVAELMPGGRADPRRPLRWRPLADRDGQAVPGAGARRASSSSPIRWTERDGTWPTPGWRTGSRSSRAT